MKKPDMKEWRAKRRQAEAEMARLKRDQKRLDWLQKQLRTSYCLDGVLFRWSAHGRGWRLHQTTRRGAGQSVRRAIDKAIAEEDKP